VKLAGCGGRAGMHPGGEPPQQQMKSRWRNLCW
jgi:hypothetical protein